MTEAALASFRAATAALFKPNECAVSSFGETEESAAVSIINLCEVVVPEALPAYWTLCVPGWYHPDMGNLEVAGWQHPRRRRLEGQVVSGKITEEGLIPDQGIDPFIHTSPFLVFEVDYLLFKRTKPGVVNAAITKESKKLQREAMAYAFQATGFPFAVLVDSGGKSIHATVRLDDDFDTIKAWRESEDFLRLQDLCSVVFGDYDRGVLRQSGGGTRLVRTPGATRDDGSPQPILATGKRTTIYNLMKWFADQLTPQAQKEVWGRQPVVDDFETPKRQRYLRKDLWRSCLTKPRNEDMGRGWPWYSEIVKPLISAGCFEAKLLQKPNPQNPYGSWKASWLWYVSAYVYNQYTNGWFFSQNPADWERPDRTRPWDPESAVLKEQMEREGANDPAKSSFVGQALSWQQNEAVNQAITAVSNNPAMQAASQALPLPPMPGPPVHVGGVTGATTVEAVTAGQPKKKTAVQLFKENLAKFAAKISSDHLVKCSPMCGDMWYRFFPAEGFWKQVSADSILQIVQNDVFQPGTPVKMIKEFYGSLTLMLTTDDLWIEYPNAIAFLNGTLYIDADGVEFKPTHDPADKLRSMVPCNYDPQAACPGWLNFTTWALPDTSRSSMLQEMFGYTLIPGQPFQSFFMMTGTGSNGKSVVLAVLQALHKDSFETVALANLGGRFSLGTIGRKRLAIDTEAENVVNAVQGEGNSSTAILKSWTGGDPVKIERKSVQGWSETINAKYIMSCNKKPRFVDPTKGVWRRLKLLKFEATIEERQADINLPTKLIAQELPGIVNWAVQGLRRLYAQNGFTQSDVLKSDLTEYQIDSDSVALFVQDFMRVAVGPSSEAWFDIRPFHKAYKDRCLESGNQAVSETEFRQRLEMLGIHIGRPQEGDTVNNCPVGTERAPGKQHWSLKGWRCYHPGYTTQTMVGNYAQTHAGAQMQGAMR